jgi:hypothetical protein
LQIEMQFAVVCFEQAEAYWNLITKVKPSTLKRLTKCVLSPSLKLAEVATGLLGSRPAVRNSDSLSPLLLCSLCRWDDELMEGFAKAFPELQNDEALSMLKEDDMKSKVGKERWRNFMMPFEKHIDDYNFGTLIRANCAEDYTEANSIFGALMELCN